MVRQTRQDLQPGSPRLPGSAWRRPRTASRTDPRTLYRSYLCVRIEIKSGNFSTDTIQINFMYVCNVRMPIFVEIGEKLSVDGRTDRQTLRPALLGQPEGIDLIIRIQPVCTHDSVTKNKSPETMPPYSNTRGGYVR